jgi:hypothetical protein
LWYAENSGEEWIADKALDDEFPEGSNASIDDFIKQHEERQEPDLRIQQCFLDLVPLDLAVQNSGTTKLATTDEQSLLFEGEAFGRDDVTWEDIHHEGAPGNGNTATNEEDSAPDREAVDLANTKADEPTKHGPNPVAAVEDTCSEWLLVTQVCYMKIQN